jgi:hypothetical protein
MRVVAEQLSVIWRKQRLSYYHMHTLTKVEASDYRAVDIDVASLQ